MVVEKAHALSKGKTEKSRLISELIAIGHFLNGRYGVLRNELDRDLMVV
jgi:hypothetical protein